VGGGGAAGSVRVRHGRCGMRGGVVKSLSLQDATIPAGTKVAIQYDDIFNGGMEGP
jgi:hypothetical protein